MTISYGMEVLDKNRKPVKDAPGEVNYQVVIKDGALILDMKQFIPPELAQTGLTMDVSGTPTEIPGNLQVGQKLKDSEVTITTEIGIIKTVTNLKFTDQECVAIEDVTVPAGTFKCYKITQTVTTTVGKNSKPQAPTTTLTWYAPNIGEIKREVYDAKKKIKSSRVLVEVKGN
jgi:hypothetical protein